MKLRSAIDGQRDYDLPERHDPLYLMFDNDFHLGERPPHSAVPCSSVLTVHRRYCHALA